MSFEKMYVRKKKILIQNEKLIKKKKNLQNHCTDFNPLKVNPK